MSKNISLMVTAYCEVTGKSVEQALKDLGIADIVHPSDLVDVSQDQRLYDLKKDALGIQAWLNARSGAAR